MARYRIRSESDVEFRMLDLLLTAPADTAAEQSNRSKVPLFYFILMKKGIFCLFAATFNVDFFFRLF